MLVQCRFQTWLGKPKTTLGSVGRLSSDSSLRFLITLIITFWKENNANRRKTTNKYKTGTYKLCNIAIRLKMYLSFPLGVQSWGGKPVSKPAVGRRTPQLSSFRRTRVTVKKERKPGVRHFACIKLRHDLWGVRLKSVRCRLLHTHKHQF